MGSLRPQVLRAIPVVDLAAYLVGTWRFAREIIDHQSGRLHLSGTAVVTRCDGGVLTYTEAATLTTGADPLQFTRSYRYELTSERTAHVQFEDGSLFHELDLGSGRSRVRHLCDDDLYIGTYLVTSDAWYLRWRCRGPHKDYVATTRLSRLHGTDSTESVA